MNWLTLNRYHKINGTFSAVTALILSRMLFIINSTTCLIANTLFLLVNKKRENDFLKGTSKPRFFQNELLMDILFKNAGTSFGIKHQFKNIRSIEDYRKQVPISEYEDYKSYIHEIKNGAPTVLTYSKVDYLALTSGTSSASKFIPYNSELKKEFAKGIDVWIANMLKGYKSLLGGKQFWIVSPVTEVDEADSAVPIGFEKDANYLGVIERLLIRQILIIPDELAQMQSLENYYYCICLLLLQNKNTRLISVWNPSMLVSIMSYISDNYKNLTESIDTGKVSLPEPEFESDYHIIQKYIQKNTKRAKELKQQAFSSKQAWPHLQLISCWTDAFAEIYINDIKALFPNVPIQGKGLLATEAITSIPLCEYDYPILTYDSHFYEFKNIDNNQLFLIDEVQKEQQYEVIITTGGGLYRYNTHDIVEIKGFVNRTPLLKYIGKSNVVSDYTGEKLNDIHVTEVINKIIRKYCKCNGAAFLKPHRTATHTFYGCYIDKEILKNGINEQALLSDLEEGLSANYHYLNSRNMKQLDACRLFLLPKNKLSEFLNLKKNQKSTQKDLRLIV